MADEDAARPKTGAEGELDRTGDEAATTAPAATLPEADGAVLRAELAETKDRLLRAQAELENFKKRAARDRLDAQRFGSEALLRDFLPVIDNLHRALEHARGSRDTEPIIAGVELVLRALEETLERHGVRAVEARGTAFDPSRHEAIGHVDSALPANTVVDEHQRGYLLHDRLLRPALVTVGKGQADGASAPAAAPDVEKVEGDD